jgi:hypothetical protein
MKVIPSIRFALSSSMVNPSERDGGLLSSSTENSIISFYLIMGIYFCESVE